MKIANSLDKIIYADNAATTKIDDEALNLMIDLQRKYFANPSSNYKISRPLKKILDESREKIAACINAEPHEIFFLLRAARKVIIGLLKIMFSLT